MFMMGVIGVSSGLFTLTANPTTSEAMFAECPPGYTPNAIIYDGDRTKCEYYNNQCCCPDDWGPGDQ